jgi:N-acetyl-gamma-glutamyl-phosphate reductase
MSDKKIKCAIIGAGGYTGAELIKIVLNHPFFELSYLGVREHASTVEELHPFLKDIIYADVKITDVDEIVQSAELAFLALPHKTSMEIASQLIAKGVKVVDLSADYRLDLELYEQHYTKHTDIDNLKHAIYGLPEINREKLKGASLIANPGCYPTASILALLPFLEHIDANTSIFIDAKSGVSGAGAGCKPTTHFGHINENIFAYNPLAHRHAPEIKSKIDHFASNSFNVTFVPHLLPVTRGMLVSIYATLKEEIDATKLLHDFYKDEEFVRVRERPVDIKSTAGTNFCDIYAISNERSIFISSSIDNLLRGASSQAVVNANLMFGLNENIGIPKIAYIP